MDAWDKLHDDMLIAAKAFIPQSDKLGGREGIERINAVETKFLKQYNDYVTIYNEVLKLTPDLKKYWNKGGQIEGIEGAIKDIEKEFLAIPKVIY